MQNKSLEIKRIIIFCVIAVIPVIIIAAVTSDGFENAYFANQEENPILYAIAGMGMLAPAIAVLLTRIITKEGFADNYLGINFNGNAKYYIASVVIPLLNNTVGVLCIWLFYMNSSFSETFTTERLGEAVPTILFTVSYSIIIGLPFFGEEWGWRGYLMPKLLKLMSKPAAIIVGGIVWGLWHAPLTVIGHNFGVDYPMFPWLGIGTMCIFCIFVNAVMTYITERTKSIYPACILHGINNNVNHMLLMSLFMSEKVVAEQTADIKSAIEFFPAMSIGIIIVAVFCMIQFCRKEKSE